MEEEDKKLVVNQEIEEMLNILGDKTPEGLVSDDEDNETLDDKDEKEQGKIDAEDEKKEEENEIDLTIKNKKNETDEDKQLADKQLADIEDKEKAALSKINADREVKEKAEEKERLRLEKEKKKNEPLKLEDQDFIGDQDIEDIIHDKDTFNKLLNSVYTKGVNDSKKISTEDILSSIPDIVKHNLNLLTLLKETSDKFYNDNKDLVPFKRVVAAVFEDIVAQNPDKKYTELMNLVAPEARKRLDLHKQVMRKEKNEKGGEKKGGGPRLPEAKSNLKHSLQKSNPTSLESEISEMNKLLGR